MDKNRYKKLVSEVFSLVDPSKLKDALSLNKTAIRVDAVQDLLRNAILNSSISMYNGFPYYFSGNIYEPMSNEEFGNLIYDLMKRSKLPFGDYSRLEGVIKVCKRIVSGKVLKLNSAIVVFRNCVFDMNTRQAHPFNKKYVQVTCVDYNYDPREVIFLWKQFLNEVIPNETWQRILQEFLGSIFVDRKTAKIETMLMLRGNGSNGKSVVFDTIMGILGKGNVSNFGLSALITGSEAKKNIAFINGKRLNYCSEVKSLEIGKDSDALKSIISGEPVEARPMYGDNFTAYDIPLLMFNVNNMPYLKDWSHGMRRRLCIIPFDVEIPIHRQRKSLSYEMEREYSAIFNWIIEGRDRFISNGYKLTESKTLDKIVDEYQAESSSVLNFMYHMGYMRNYEDISDIEPKWINCKNLYSLYKKWCRKSEIEIDNVTRFGRVLGDAGYRKKRAPGGIIYGIYGKPVMKDMIEKRLEISRKKRDEENK